MEENFEQKLEEIRKKGRVKMKQNKVYSKIGLIFILIFAVLFLGSIFYLFNKLNKTKTKDSVKTYYEILKEGCDNEGCCLSSVKFMEEGNFTEAKDGSCPDGFKSNMLRCISSYKWCEPEVEGLSKKEETEIDVSNWKNYRNEALGFEFNYSNDCTLSSREHVGESIIEEFAVSCGNDNFIIVSFEKSESFNKQLETERQLCLNWLGEFDLSDNDPDDNITSFVDNGVRNILNLEGCGNNIGLSSEGLYFSKDEKLFIRVMGNMSVEKSDIYEKTISFLQSTQRGIGTSNWKTYWNEELEFEFKYPENLDINLKNEHNNGNYGFLTYEIIKNNNILSDFSIWHWDKSGIIVDIEDAGTFWHRISYKNWKYFIDNFIEIKSGECSKEVEERLTYSVENCNIEKYPNYIKQEADNDVIFYNNKYQANFSWDPKREEIDNIKLIKEIISTFKFTNEEVIDKWKIYRNEEFGVEFSYEKDCEIKIEEDKVIVCGDQYVEIFNKDENKDLKESIEEDFLKDYSSKECFYKKLKESTDNTEYGIISFPIDNNSEIPWWDNNKNCPQEYSETNGIRYFIEDADYTNRYAFFDIGQYAIMGSEDKTWQQTFKFIDKEEVINWKIYQEEELGLEFKYPEEFFVETIEGDVIVSSTDGHRSPLNTVQIIKIEEEISDALSRVKTRDQITRVIEEKKIINNGISFDKLTVTAAIGYNDSHYFFSLNGNNFEVIFVENSTTEPLLDKIFSTIKIIDN
jgi:hypothetical protein